MIRERVQGLGVSGRCFQSLSNKSEWKNSWKIITCRSILILVYVYERHEWWQIGCNLFFSPFCGNLLQVPRPALAFSCRRPRVLIAAPILFKTHTQKIDPMGYGNDLRVFFSQGIPRSYDRFEAKNMYQGSCDLRRLGLSPFQPTSISHIIIRTDTDWVFSWGGKRVQCGDNTDWYLDKNIPGTTYLHLWWMVMTGWPLFYGVHPPYIPGTWGVDLHRAHSMERCLAGRCMLSLVCKKTKQMHDCCRCMLSL